MKFVTGLGLIAVLALAWFVVCYLYYAARTVIRNSRRRSQQREGR